MLPARFLFLFSCPAAQPPLHPSSPLDPIPLQNLEVLYRQYGRDGSKHGLDWQEVAVCIVQDGLDHCDKSVLASSTVQVGTGGAGFALGWGAGAW